MGVAYNNSSCVGIQEDFKDKICQDDFFLSDDLLSTVPCPPVWNTNLLWITARGKGLPEDVVELVAARCAIPRPLGQSQGGGDTLWCDKACVSILIVLAVFIVLILGVVFVILYRRVYSTKKRPTEGPTDDYQIQTSSSQNLTMTTGASTNYVHYKNIGDDGMAIENPGYSIDKSSEVIRSNSGSSNGSRKELCKKNQNTNHNNDILTAL